MICLNRLAMSANQTRSVGQIYSLFFFKMIREYGFISSLSNSDLFNISSKVRKHHASI